MIPDVREQASTLLEIAHDAIIVRDPQGRITFWNSGAEQIYGWKRDEALGRVTHSLLETQFPSSLSAVDEELARKGHWEGELVHRPRDGKEIVLLSRQVLQRDQEGKPSAVLEINRDVATRKKAEEALHPVQRPPRGGGRDRRTHRRSCPRAPERLASRWQNSLATRRAQGSFCSTNSTANPSSL